MTPPFCQLRILVAERDLATQRLTARTLEGMGMAVVLANSGREALARFTSDHFDLVFMGLEMLDMDGFGAAAAIRYYENVFDERVPIIAMTTLRNSGERERCLTAGMDSYMERPTSSQQIQIALLAFTNPDSLRPLAPPLKWDRTRALRRVGGDEHLLTDLIAIFAREEPKLLDRMEQALVERRPDLLRLAARDLQEKLNYLGAAELSETARKLAGTANQPDFLKAVEMAAVLRLQLAVTDFAMNKN